MIQLLIRTFIRDSDNTASRTVRMECDVRGMTLDEALIEVEKYLDEAVMAGMNEVCIVHGKGTGSHSAQKFYAVSLASEKEIVLILTKTEQKTAIMRSILKEAGPDSPAGSIVFSLPVTEIAGFGFTKEEE